MKNIKFIILLILSVLNTTIQAQEPSFKGIITYESINNNYLKTKDKNKIWKSSIKIYVSDKDVRIDRIESRSTNELFKHTSIINLEDSSAISFFTNSDKAALFESGEKIDSLKNLLKDKNNLEIIYTNKTKRFLGYKCKKADYQKADGSKKGYAYYTTKIILPKLVNEYLNLDKIEGLVMQFSYCYLDNDKIKIPDYSTHTVKEITRCDIEPNIFLMPDDYKLFDNYEDYRNNYKVWRKNFLDLSQKN